MVNSQLFWGDCLGHLKTEPLKIQGLPAKRKDMGTLVGNATWGSFGRVNVNISIGSMVIMVYIYIHIPT